MRIESWKNAYLEVNLTDRKQSRKKESICRILDAVLRAESPDLIFNNALVKKITGRSFSNQFDATKFDTTDSLPECLKERDCFIQHLGGGHHRFLRGISLGYHSFEPIPTDQVRDWEYKPAILNGVGESEAAVLSLVFNQQVLQHFLFNDRTIIPKIHLPRRTKGTFEYSVGTNPISVNGLQIEKDLVIEHQGTIVIFEAKNGDRKDFSVSQLYNPYRHLDQLAQTGEITGVAALRMVYILRVVDQESGKTMLRLYEYEFTDKQRLDSIAFVKSAQYNLREVT